MVINMGRKKRNEEKRGRKHPEGFTKRKILLIALEHPDGIKERDLIEEIKNKLDIVDDKGIKGHLADLGNGRKIAGREKGKTWKDGKHYLIKTEQSGKPNIWKPNTNREIFEDIWSNELQNREEVLSFFNSRYTQRMISDEYMDGYKGLKIEEDNVETFFGGDYAETFFEEGMKLSPTFLQYSIHAGLPEVEVAADILHSALETSKDARPFRIYMDGLPKEFDITSSVGAYAELLYVSLLIDSKKYPELRSKIIDFFEGPAFGPPYFNLPFPDLLMI